MNQNSEKSTVLIVDDVAENIHVLDGILKPNYRIKAALDGHVAIRIACSDDPPDLILLDIMMPEMDGFDVVKVLKSNPKTRHIPVIFISALDKVDDKIRGLLSGGVDYITKPFSPEEVEARVHVHMTLQLLQRDLSEKNQQLAQAYDELEQRSRELSQALDHLKMTQKQLVQSEKMAALGQLVAGVAHELNTPIGIGYSESSFLRTQTREISDKFHSGKLTKSDFEAYIQNVMESSESIFMNLQRAAELILSFKQVAVDQTHDEKRQLNLKSFIQEILISLRPQYKRTDHQIEVHCPESIQLNTFPGALGQVLTNLVQNSLIHGFNGVEQGTIRIEAEKRNGHVRMIYQDNGRGMAPEHMEKVFDPFFTTKRGQGGTGLGMHVVYNLVTQKLGGHIECHSEPGHGVTFIVDIPCEK